jgi:hypothetical protein
VLLQRQISHWHYVRHNKLFVSRTGTAHDTQREKTVSEVQRHSDVDRPPNVDTSSDGGAGPHDVVGIIEAQDVPGTLEIHYLSSEACENKEQADWLPTATRQVSKSKTCKERCLSDDLSDWSKTSPSYTHLSAKGNQAGLKMEDLIKKSSIRCHLKKYLSS